MVIAAVLGALKHTLAGQGETGSSTLSWIIHLITSQSSIIEIITLLVFLFILQKDISLSGLLKLIFEGFCPELMKQIPCF